MDDDTLNLEVPAPEYSESEEAYRSWIIRRLETARDQRDAEHVEFDGQTFLEHWESNAKAANAFIAPKINREDVRVTTGTTLEKKNTLLAALLNMNFDADIEAYDDNDREVIELGQVMEDMIKKSRKLEPVDWETKKMLIYNELLNQGDVVIEDVNVKISMPQKTLKKMGTKLSEMEWSDRLDKVHEYLDTRIINMTNVYFGNVREYFLENQPFIFTRRLVPRDEAKAIYGEWERWENVPMYIDKLVDDGSDTVDYNEWSLEQVERDKVEIVMYYDKWYNNFMIILNGVLMFPVRKDKKDRFNTIPLSSLTGRNEYPMAKGSLEPISRFFAYSKSIPAKTKVDQQVFDEMYKAIMLKTRKSYQPPMANNTGQILSRRIFYPANITKGIDPTKLQEIGENKGVTAPEFNAAQWLKKVIDEKTVAPIMEGQSQGGRQTAREIMAQMQQSKQRIGVSILGVMGLEKRMAQLRLWNILKYWTAPIDKSLVTMKDGVKKTVNKYKNITIDSDLNEGIKGTKVIQMTEGEQPGVDQLMAEEDIMSKVQGKTVRKIYLNPKMLKEIDYHWYIEVIPTEKDSSQLKLAMFEETVQKILSLFAPIGKLPNLDYLAERWALLAGENPDKLWPPAPAPQQLPQMQQEPPAPNQEGKQPISNRLQPRKLPKQGEGQNLVGMAMGG